MFLLIASLEILRPRRRLQQSRVQRWRSNFGLSALNSFLVALLVPVAGVGAALVAENNGWGLLNNFQTPYWVGFLAYLLVFDLTIYWQHRLFHRIKLLWRLHRVHHTDLDYDVTTGVRFHPLSILVSTIIKLCLIALIGPAALAVLTSELLLNAMSMFNHSNIKIPLRLDAMLRFVLITPDMHRVHHSVNSIEHNKNFGFNFPWWDRIFGSYLAQPSEGHERMKIGIKDYEAKEESGFLMLLTQPLRREKTTEAGRE